MKEKNTQEILLIALQQHNLKVISHEGKIFSLEKEYIIEVEGKQLFKLLQAGQVVAPFSDPDELCQFIKMDMQLNEES